MKYTVRIATEDDIRGILPYTTENSKVDWAVVRQSGEIRAFCCDGTPIMILGLLEFPTGDYLTTAALWGLFHRDVEKHKVSLIRACQDLLFSRVGYRLVCYIDTNEPKFIRFAEFFGFEETKELAELNGKLYRYYIKEN